MKAMLLKTSQTQDCTLYSKTPDTERFMKTTDEIRARLFELQDLKYKEFNSKLIPTVPPERFIGVRIPDLRKLAKETAKETNKKKPVSSKSDSRKTFESNEVIAKSESTKFTLGDSMGTENAMQFLNDLPHYYHEENALHGYIIEQIKDYETCLAEINRFLPYVDNWAVCDCFCWRLRALMDVTAYCAYPFHNKCPSLYVIVLISGKPARGAVCVRKNRSQVPNDKNILTQNGILNYKNLCKEYAQKRLF